MSDTIKKETPPEVSYLPEDSVVRNIPLSFLVRPIREQQQQWEQEIQRLLNYFSR